MLTDWYYSRSFNVDPKFASSRQILLVCEGVDTLSNIILNGKSVGITSNMFQRYIFEVTDLVRGGENNIQVDIFSAVNHGLKKMQEYPYELPVSDLPDYQHGFFGKNFFIISLTFLYSNKMQEEIL